jgi:hypothetical protein
MAETRTAAPARHLFQVRRYRQWDGRWAWRYGCMSCPRHGETFDSKRAATNAAAHAHYMFGIAAVADR